MMDDLCKRAEKVTMSTLNDFLAELAATPTTHETEPNIVAAAGIAAAWAMNDSIGSLCNMGASYVMWEFIKHWMGKSGPMRLLCFEDMLYPQYEYRFEKTLDFETAEWLRISAHNKMQEWFKGTYAVDPGVFWHWHRLDSGELPFGYRKEEKLKQ